MRGLLVFLGPASRMDPRGRTARVARPSGSGQMVNRPVDMNAFEFVVISAVRARQLLAGSMSRRDGGHNASTTAQMEVADRCVARSENEASATRQCGWQIYAT